MIELIIMIIKIKMFKYMYLWIATDKSVVMYENGLKM